MMTMIDEINDHLFAENVDQAIYNRNEVDPNCLSDCRSTILTGKCS